MSRIVGIDLGTSTSEIACLIGGIPTLIPNSLGKAVTPSVVHIREDGEILVGEPAAQYLLTRPDCTFMEVKRLTGSGQVLHAHGKEYTPEQIQSYLLRYLIKCAEKHLGEPLTRAVITVPAYFTDAQRRATAKAGELAGLTVERILNEPTAAALDYGLSNLTECKNILVYDLGGGTLDVTVLELFEGVIDVKASSGNNHLGGKDFDELLMKHFADPGDDERALMRLKKAAEECKIALSEKNEHDVSLPFLYTAMGGKPVSVEKTVTREEFEALIREKVSSTRAPMVSALSDAGLSAQTLDFVLLVGGSTRIPYVRKLVEETLDIVPSLSVDPDLTVARGAAVQAAILDGSLEGAELALSDVCPYTLGAEVLAKGAYDDRLICSPIIPRNTPIPTELSHIYFPAEDYQTCVQIKAYQGESLDPENNSYLGEVELSGIPRSRKKDQPIEVTFAYDMNGILQVRAKALSNGKEVSAQIDTSGVGAAPIPDLSAWAEAPGAKRFRPLLRKAEKLIAKDEDEGGDIELLIRKIKEALVLEKTEQAEELRNELMALIELKEAGI